MSLPVLRLPGVSFREDLTGTYWWLSRPVDERRMSLRLTASAADVGLTMQSGIWTLSGTIYADGLAHASHVEGTLAFRLFDEQRLPYRFSFRADDGRVYELCGQKEWNALSPLDTVTLLPASLFDGAGAEVARATLRFDLRADWSDWLRNVKWGFANTART